MCARIEPGNDRVKVQVLGLSSAMQYALKLGLQDLVVECEIKGPMCKWSPLIYELATF